MRLFGSARPSSLKPFVLVGPLLQPVAGGHVVAPFAGPLKHWLVTLRGSVPVGPFAVGWSVGPVRFVAGRPFARRSSARLRSQNLPNTADELRASRADRDHRTGSPAPSACSAGLAPRACLQRDAQEQRLANAERPWESIRKQGSAVRVHLCTGRDTVGSRTLARRDDLHLHEILASQIRTNHLDVVVPQCCAGLEVYLLAVHHYARA